LRGNLREIFTYREYLNSMRSPDERDAIMVIRKNCNGVGRSTDFASRLKQ
jgi:hypothetical protein